MYGIPQPSDDISALKWFLIDDIKENDIVPEHIPLINRIKEHFKL
jgi:hypothetical protein